MTYDINNRLKLIEIYYNILKHSEAISNEANFMIKQLTDSSIAFENIQFDDSTIKIDSSQYNIEALVSKFNKIIHEKFSEYED